MTVFPLEKGSQRKHVTQSMLVLAKKETAFKFPASTTETGIK